MKDVGELVVSQGRVLGTALVTGMALCFLYDILRTLRRVFPHGERSVGLEDLGYWICWTLAVMVLLGKVDRGAVRAFSLGGVGAGMLLYLFLISPWLLRGMVFVAGKAAWLVGGLFRFLLYPFRKIAKIISSVVRYIWQKGTCFFRKRKKTSAEEEHERKA